LGWTSDKVRGDVSANDFKDRRLNVIVGDAFDVAVSDFLVPYLQRFTPVNENTRQ
jgi:hypothetical protein